MKRPQTKKVADEPSWLIRTRNVELALSQRGGQMAPVKFYLHGPGKPVQPYYISPWQGEKLKIDEPVLAPLRGDFFCMPFGANVPARGKVYKVHGEPAGNPWRLVGTEQDGDVLSLTTSMTTQVMPGNITKKLMLVEGHNVVYSQHILTGYSGRAPLGHQRGSVSKPVQGPQGSAEDRAERDGDAGRLPAQGGQAPDRLRREFHGPDP